MSSKKVAAHGWADKVEAGFLTVLTVQQKRRHDANATHSVITALVPTGANLRRKTARFVITALVAVIHGSTRVELSR